MQDGVRRIQDLAEQVELLAQDLEGQLLRLVVPVDESDDRHVPRLAVAVATPDALLDALRVPGQVVVDHRLAELEVQSLGSGLGAHQHLGPRAEFVNQGEPHGDLAARLAPGSEVRALFRLPAGEGLARARMIVDTAEKGDLLVLKPIVEEQLPQVLLGRDRLGEDHGFAAAGSVAATIEDEPDRLQERARLGVARQGARASEEVLHAGQLGQDASAIHWRSLLGFDRLRQLLLVLQVAQVAQVAQHRGRSVLGIPPSRQPAEPGGHVLQARGERGDRGRHAPVEPDEQETALPAGKREQRGLEQVLGHVVVERPFVDAHRVLVEPAPPLGERPVEELLGLAAERALEHPGEASLELVLLPGNQGAVVLGAEHLAEGRDVAEQSAGRLDVLHQAPELDQGVLDGGRREQENRRGAQKAADAVGHPGLVRVFVINAVAVVSLVQPREDLVGLVDDHQVERRRGGERCRAALAAREFASDQVDAGGEKARRILSRLNAEELEELVLPLADERLRHDQQDALSPLGPALRDDQPGLDRLPEPDLVRENAATLLEPAEREDHGVDLVRIGIDARLALRCRIALPVIGTADPDQILGEETPVEGVEAR